MFCIRIHNGKYYDKRTSSLETRSVKNASCWVYLSNAIEKAKALVSIKEYPLVYIDEIMDSGTLVPMTIVIRQEIYGDLLGKRFNIEQA